MAMPSRTRRYSGSDRPAWRMNHTGVGSSRACRRAGEHEIGRSLGDSHRSRRLILHAGPISAS